MVALGVNLHGLCDLTISGQFQEQALLRMLNHILPVARASLVAIWGHQIALNLPVTTNWYAFVVAHCLVVVVPLIPFLVLPITTNMALTSTQNMNPLWWRWCMLLILRDGNFYTLNFDFSRDQINLLTSPEIRTFNNFSIWNKYLMNSNPKLLAILCRGKKTLANSLFRSIDSVNRLFVVVDFEYHKQSRRHYYSLYNDIRHSILCLSFSYT